MDDRSSVTRTLTYDPGADAAQRYPEWVIRHRDLRGVPEVMCVERQVILLEDSHDRSARRCSLAHAVAHIDLGHQAAKGVLSARQELAADKLAARRLIHAEALADAVLWADSFADLAAELDVDDRTLLIRLTHLRAAEQRLLFERVSTKAQSA